MNFLKVTKDGGPESRVWAHWLIEIKGLFSVALLRFEDGSRDSFHSHAFNSISWVVRGGGLLEEHLDGRVQLHDPGFKPIKTFRDTFHRVKSFGRTWVLTFRGPWAKEWKEYTPETNETVRLTHGRVESGKHMCVCVPDRMQNPNAEISCGICDDTEWCS